MDTRVKIVSAAEAERIAADGATVVSGYFDPLLASHAERLSALKRAGVPLLVAIADPENPILPARARAELVAGLAAVDRVVEAGAGLKVDVRLEEEDARRLDALIEHVHARNSGS
jgi:bifunctional ADP-heptose synthase (sugar kinase/adenylyltransferase)